MNMTIITLTIICDVYEFDGIATSRLSSPVQR